MYRGIFEVQIQKITTNLNKNTDYNKLNVCKSQMKLEWLSGGVKFPLLRPQPSQMFYQALDMKVRLSRS